MIYPKIQTIWKRDNGIIQPGSFSCPEFGNVLLWDVSEKVDGTNVRIVFDAADPYYDASDLYYGHSLLFKGRREQSELPDPLWRHLNKTFSYKFFERVFPDAKSVTVFGEGYGPGVQKGGGSYRDDVSFVGFDIVVDGWWLKQQAVYDILSDNCIPVVPCLGRGTIDQIIRFIKRGHPSCLSLHKRDMEGIVARSYPLMLFRNGLPLMFKSKVRDYKELDSL